MIRCGEDVLDSEVSARGGQQCQGELGASVSGNSGRHDETCHPTGDEGVHACGSLQILSGIASTHCVDLSMTVSRYTCLSSEDGRGPTKSRRRCENLHASTRMAASCFWTLPRCIAGICGAWLPPLSPPFSRQTVRLPYSWWHVYQSGPCCGQRGRRQPNPPREPRVSFCPEMRHTAGWLTPPSLCLISDVESAT